MKISRLIGVLPRLALLTALSALAPAPLPAEKVRLERSSPITRSMSFPGLEYDQFRVVDVDPATAAALVAAGAGEIIQDADRLLLNAEIVDTTQPEVKALRRPLGAFQGKRLHLVHFSGPIREKWVAALEADGLRVIAYVPTHAFLVYGDAPALGRFQARAFDPASAVQWEGAWLDRWKVAPSVWGRKGKAPETASQLKVQLVEDKAANDATFAALAAAGGKILREPQTDLGYVNFNLQLDPAALSVLTARPELVSVHRHTGMRVLDESQATVLAGRLTGNVATPGNYLTQLANWGFTQNQFDTSNFVVDVSDQGVDDGTTTPNNFSLYRNGSKAQGSRLVYRVTAGTAGSDAGRGVRGHGNIDVSIIGGFVPNTSVTVGGNTTTTTAFPHADANQFRYGLGIAPFVKLGNTTIFDPNDTSPNYSTVQSNAYAAGARISSNSWGEGSGSGAYTSDSQTFDARVRDAQTGTAGNQQMVIVFAAGNDGPGSNTVGSPSTAKNVITVGAAEGVRGGGTDADSANDIADFSGRGPCDDGRRKPDLMAGGTRITGLVWVTANSTLNGTADPAYLGTNTSGFSPGGQQWTARSSGTSQATPAIAGGAALVYQQFINNPAYLATHRTPAGSAPPSPALVKAYLMNSTRYMTGVDANDTLPSNAQGMGHGNLGMAFDGVTRIIRDQVTADRVATGQTRVFTGTVADNTKPFRVTLAWTDPPGSTVSAAYVNNLNLTVETAGAVYRGNVFSGATSVAFGVSDPRNNVESVFLPAGVADTFVVTVTGASVPASSPQDFALVVYNGAATSVPVLNDGTPVISSPGSLQPNSCVTMNIPLTNGGTAHATSVSANLSTTTPGVTVVQADSSYLDLTAGGAARTNDTPFRISTDASVPCGTLASFTLLVTHSGGFGFSVMEFSLPVGTDPANYVFTPSSGAVFPSGTDVKVPGSSVASGVFSVTVPFGFSVYGTSVAAGGTVRVSTKGVLQLRASGGSAAGANVALPTSDFDVGATLLPYWDDLDVTDGDGIHTISGGTAPNRKWCIYWAGRLIHPYPDGVRVVFGIVLTEGVPGFQYIYSNVGDFNGPNGSTATVGVQASPTGLFAQYGFNQYVLTNNLTLTATPGSCVAGSGPCAAPDIISPPSAFAVVGSPFSHTFTATGSPTPTFSLTGGTLPPGLSLSAGGVLSGTLTAAGTGTYSGILVTASNALSPSSTQDFTLRATTVAANYLASFGLTGQDALLTADPNGDGTNNLLAYALGLSPIANAGVYDIGTVRDYAGTKYLSIRFNRSSLATDLTYIVEATDDLTFNWQELAYSSSGNPMLGTGGVVVSETGGPPTYVTEVRDTTPAPPTPGVPQRFIRLRVVAQP